MKAIVCQLILVCLSFSLSANTIDLGCDTEGIRYTQLSPTKFRLELSIAKADVNDRGEVTLSDTFHTQQISPYDLPWIEVHIAIEQPAAYTYSLQNSTPPVALGMNKITERALPDNPVLISQPYILRDLTGVDVFIFPFVSRDGQLSIQNEMMIDFQSSRDQAYLPSTSQNRKQSPWFTDIYQEHFINYDARYADIAEYGSMAVICPTEFHELIQPWVDWKNQKGIPTTVHHAAYYGATYESIKGYIQDLYLTDPHLTFVQLIGDFDRLPCLVTGSGSAFGSRDADYALLAGDDNYPDIFVGRFSAETYPELYTQIKRSIEYEKELSDEAWLSRAAGVCSQNPPIPGDDDEHNWTHLDNIRTKLLDYTYNTVDRIYANEGASTQDLIDSINAGKSLLNYCGEGYEQYWVAPEFHNADIANLTNYNQLPFIHSVSCMVGQFSTTTCLAEAFMRSCDPTAEIATGAIAVYAAAPHQGVAPPMRAQDHLVDLLISGSKNTIGGLCFNGACNMIDVYPEGGFENFWGWNLFGDCSLQLRTDQAATLNVTAPSNIPSTASQLSVNVRRADLLVSLSLNNGFLASGFSDAAGNILLAWDAEITASDVLILTVTGFNCQTYQREIYVTGNDQLYLQTTVSSAGQRIEPLNLVTLDITVSNVSSVPANNLSVELRSYGNFNAIIPVQDHATAATLSPGQSTTLSLSYRLEDHAYDLTYVHYEIITVCGTFARIQNCSDLVRAPILGMYEVDRLPTSNWVYPGSDETLTFTIHNGGSAPLRGLNTRLICYTTGTAVVHAEAIPDSIPAGGAAQISYTVRIAEDVLPQTRLDMSLDVGSENYRSFGSNYRTLVIPRNTMMESFETSDLDYLPWVFNPDEWSVFYSGYDGIRCLMSNDAASADSISLSLSFSNQIAGGMSYVLYRDTNGTGGTVSVYLNGVLANFIGGETNWDTHTIDLYPGFNTIRWVVTKANDAVKKFGIFLDAIQFPAQTIFANTTLNFDVSQINLVLKPGEIIDFPLELTSPEGKYISYAAILQEASPTAKPAIEPYLSCSQIYYHPGSSEQMLFTLYNPVQDSRITGLKMELPDQVLSVSATSLIMNGIVGLPFTGQNGSLCSLRWENATGSAADSLRTAIRFISDVHSTRLSLHYTISYLDAYGNDYQCTGAIELASADSLGHCISMINTSGELIGDMKKLLYLHVNQNNFTQQQANYTLTILYNGTNTLSIPLTISYDDNPAGFYDKVKLSNYPNPVRENTTFAFSVPSQSVTELVIYNLKGQRVKTVSKNTLNKGYYRTLWYRDDEQGNPVGNGIYLCRIKTGKHQQKTLKIMVIK